MTELTIDRLVTQAEVRGAADEARVRRLVADLTGRELEVALESAAVPDGLWCLRRLEVDLELDHHGDRDLGRTWARAVVDALLDGLSARGDSSPDVVRYARPEQILTDLVTELAHGRTERAWAWRTLGAVAAGDPDPDTDPRGAILAALARRPQAIVAVVADALTAAGFAPLHRLLGAAGWRTLAGWVLAAAGESVDEWLAVEERMADTAPARREPESPSVARTVAGRSRIASTWRRSGARLGLDGARAVALLALAEAEPALLRRPDVRLLDSVVQASDPGSANPGSGLVVPHDSTPPPLPTPGRADSAVEDGTVSTPTHRDRESAASAAAGGSRSAASGVSPADADDEAGESTARPSVVAEDRLGESTALKPESPGQEPTSSDDRESGEVTALGGVVYLLATAESAEIPDALIADPALAHELPSALLHQLLVMIAGADPHDDDPALRALSGVTREDALGGGERVGNALAPHVDRWRQATADRLDADDPREAIVALVRRPGRVVIAPGWVEFHLRLADVDLDVRRAGLDLDPGFVPWLGSVVVIRYE